MYTVFTDDYWDNMYEQVIGQFNLGFIICKLDQDLFIVDQVISNILTIEYVVSSTIPLND